MTERWLKTSGLLATLGGALLAVVGIQDYLGNGRFSAEPGRYKMVILVGILLAAVGFVLAVAGTILIIGKSVRGRMTDVRFCFSRLAENSLEDFHAFCRSLFGDDIASLERMRKWIEKNPDAMRTLHRLTRYRLSHKSELVGFFSVFPVTKDGKEKLAQNKLKGTELTPEFIVSPGHHPAAFYIGGVGAKGFRARERTLGALTNHLNSLGKTKVLIYARPVTRDGLRLVNQHEFQPVVQTFVKPSGNGEMTFVLQIGV